MLLEKVMFSYKLCFRLTDGHLNHSAICTEQPDMKAYSYNSSVHLVQSRNENVTATKYVVLQLVDMY